MRRGQNLQLAMAMVLQPLCDAFNHTRQVATHNFTSIVHNHGMVVIKVATASKLNAHIFEDGDCDITLQYMSKGYDVIIIVMATWMWTKRNWRDLNPSLENDITLINNFPFTVLSVLAKHHINRGCRPGKLFVITERSVDTCLPDDDTANVAFKKKELDMKATRNWIHMYCLKNLTQ